MTISLANLWLHPDPEAEPDDIAPVKFTLQPLYFIFGKGKENGETIWWAVITILNFQIAMSSKDEE